MAGRAFRARLGVRGQNRAFIEPEFGMSTEVSLTTESRGTECLPWLGHLHLKPIPPAG